MYRTIRRKDFLKLTITVATAGTTGIVGCGDDDDGTTGGAGTSAGGSGGHGGSNTSGSGGRAGSNANGGSSAGSSNGGGTPNDAGAGGGGGASGDAGAAGDGGSAQAGGGGAGAGAGGETTGGASGEGGAGLAGQGADAGAAGSGGDGPVSAPKCDQASMTETPVTHDHLPESFTFFANFVNGSTPTSPFRLEAIGAGQNAHWHDLQLTPQEVQTLRAGGTVTGKVSTRSTTVLGGVDANGHTHTYSISCT